MSLTLDQALYGAAAGPAAASATNQPLNANGEPQKPFLPALYAKLMGGIRASNSMPTSDDYKYFESFPEFKERSSQLGERLLTLIGRLSDKVHDRQDGETDLKELDDDLDRFQVVQDTMDTALENVDLHLDDLMGLNKHDRAPLGSSASAPGAAAAMVTKKNALLRRSSTTMAKPQVKFSGLYAVDNSSAPWIPVIRNKPHAVAPLPDYDSFKNSNNNNNSNGKAISVSAASSSSSSTPPSPQISAALESHLRSLGVSGSGDNKNAVNLPHPYQTEIESLKYKDEHVSVCKEQLYLPLSDVPCHWIDDEDKLQELAEKLDSAGEFAIDLEHHNYRSYQGFTCLMQISTRTEDFLIDTLELRSHLHVLNSSFANPAIVKVLHGADMDILWLQRDFGLYVVNMFDTGQCARVMEFPSFGLAYLLSHYCGVHTDKKYQLADWRVRPLPAEMLLYARQDTHYLLYIYDRLKNEVIERSSTLSASSAVVNANYQASTQSGKKIAPLLAQTLDRSAQVSLRKYEKEVVTSQSHLALVSKFGLVLSEPQMRVLQALYKWRDDVARDMDESVLFVMPNHVLINVCSTVPLDSMQLMQCCSPVPPLVRQHSGAIVKLIHQAKARPAASPLFTSTSTPDGSLPSDFSLSSSSSASAPSVVSTPLKASSASSMFLSPVQSTEQLYQSAGWVSLSGGPEGPSGIPLFDLSSLLETPQTQRKRSMSEVEVLSNDTPLEPALRFSLSDAEDEDEEMEKENGQMDQQAIDRKKAEEVRQSLKNPAALAPFAARSTQHLTVPVSIRSVSTSSASSSSSSSSSSALSTPSRPPSSSSSSLSSSVDGDLLKTPDTGEGSRYAKASSNVASSMLSPPPVALASMTSPVSDEVVPRSMREIYKISNENRRKNKNKDKSKNKDKKADDEEEDESAGSEPKTPMKKTRNQAGSQESGSSAQAFMESIGWVSSSSSSSASSSSDASLASPQKRKSTEPSSSSVANPKAKPFVPFDYSKVQQPQQQPQQQQQQFFNPYVDKAGGKQQQQQQFGKVSRSRTRVNAGNQGVTTFLPHQSNRGRAPQRPHKGF